MSESEETVKADELGQGDNSEEPTSEEPSSQGDPQPAELASQLMQNPQVLAALQNRLGDIVGSPSGYIQSLPKPVKRRIKALKKIQFNATKIEAEFYREVHKLECKYAARYAPLYEQRATMVTGDYEPNDEEADWPSDDEKDEELSEQANEDKSKKEDVKNKASLDEKEDEKEKADEEGKDSDAKGIPGFWLTIFKNVDMLSEMIQPQDEPILNLLRDVKVEFVDVNDVKEEKDPMGFKLQFHFESNDYFENKTLTKEYVMRSVPDETDPFSFEGPEIVKCTGCTIDWKKGKNVTVKTVKKKQKHKASGTTRTISKTVQSDSFFNFFNPPTPPDDEEMDEDTEALLAADFEIGHFIRERIVPRAVLYFTGEALENDDEYEDGEEEEGGDEDYDEDADGDYNPQDGKFITPRFQAQCAKLALAQPTKPSSAPCDTRLLFRPNSASNPRPKSVSVANQEPPPTSNTTVRPVTAPFSRPATRAQSDNVKPTVTMDQSENTTKPPVKTEAFTRSNSDAGRPKSVSFKTTQYVGIEDQGDRPTIHREKTKILSTTIKPEQKPGGNDEQIKLTREQTFFGKKSVEDDKKSEKAIKNVGEPKPIAKETDKKEESKSNVTESSHKSDDLPKNSKGTNSDTLSDSKIDGKTSVVCVQEIQEKVAFKNVSAKTDTGLSKVRKPASETIPKAGHASDTKTEKMVNSGTNQGKVKIEPKLESEVESGVRSKSGKSAGGSIRLTEDKDQKDLDKEKTNQGNKPSQHGKKPVNTKDEAFTILKKLTGKGRPHKPGQVPSVQRSVRKYRFDKPTGPSSSSVIQAIIADKNKADGGLSDTASAPSTAMNPRQQARPIERSISGTQRSHTKTNSLLTVTKPQSAPPQKTDKASAKRREQTGKQLDKTTEDRSEHYEDQPANRQSSVKTGSKRQEIPQTSYSTKGVRLVNGLIATEVSESIDMNDPEMGDPSYSEYGNIPNLHPKLRESPYLKGNPLLMSGKVRLRPSASSMGRTKEGDE